MCIPNFNKEYIFCLKSSFLQVSLTTSISISSKCLYMFHFEDILSSDHPRPLPVLLYDYTNKYFPVQSIQCVAVCIPKTLQIRSYIFSEYTYLRRKLLNFHYISTTTTKYVNSHYSVSVIAHTCVVKFWRDLFPV